LAQSVNYQHQGKRKAMQQQQQQRGASRALDPVLSLADGLLSITRLAQPTA